MKKYGVLIAFVLSLLLVFSILHAERTVWYVHPDSALNTIQAGLDSCVDNDIVLVGPGIYYENIIWPNTQGIHLISELGSEVTIIDGDGAFSSVIEINTSVDSTTVIRSFTVQNGSFYSGGGIHCGPNSSPSLTNVTISGNSASRGSGIYCDDNSSPSLTNVTISGNTGGGPFGSWGGGIYCDDNSSPSLTNVTISGNTAAGGGGIYCSNSNPTLANVTISGNTATNFGGGGIYCWYSSPILMNCILWNDTPQEIYIESGSVTATYSDIQGGWTGTGNIDEDPMFVSGPLSDYHLSLNSPCIDAGNPDPQYNDPEDPLNPGYAMWPALGTVRNDMGVYGGPGTEGWVYIEEYKPPQPMSTVLQISPNPFHDRININFSIEHSAKGTELKIYDATGRLVKEFGHTANQRFNQVIWAGDDNYGNKLPSGVYFLKFTTERVSETRKLLLIR